MPGTTDGLPGIRRFPMVSPTALRSGLGVECGDDVGGRDEAIALLNVVLDELAELRHRRPLERIEQIALDLRLVAEQRVEEERPHAAALAERGEVGACNRGIGVVDEALNEADHDNEPAGWNMLSAGALPRRMRRRRRGNGAPYAASVPSTIASMLNRDTSRRDARPHEARHSGLAANAEHVAFDYWGNKFIPSLKGRLQLTVSPESCVALGVRPRANHPQLISTSRHVTQGIVDVMDEKWDAATKTLSGRSKLVGEDPYELRIAHQGANVKEVTVADVTASHESDEFLTRVKFTSPASREVSWSVQFK